MVSSKSRRRDQRAWLLSKPALGRCREKPVAIRAHPEGYCSAAMLGVPIVNSFIGRDPRWSVDENWPRFQEVWPPLFGSPRSMGSRSESKTVPEVLSVAMSGLVARTLPTRRQSGGGCSRRFPARASG